MTEQIEDRRLVDLSQDVGEGRRKEAWKDDQLLRVLKETVRTVKRAYLRGTERVREVEGEKNGMSGIEVDAGALISLEECESPLGRKGDLFKRDCIICSIPPQVSSADRSLTVCVLLKYTHTLNALHSTQSAVSTSLWGLLH